MELSQAGIAKLYLVAFALGVVLGLFFDVIRFPRMLAGISKEGKRSTLRKRRAIGVLVFLEDFLFCIFGSVSVILLFYEHNRGKIRPIAFCLILTAFFLYRATVGKWIKKGLERLAEGIRMIVHKICAVLWKPISKLLHAVYRAMREKLQKWQRKAETRRLFRLVEQNAAGLLPGGVRLPKKKKEAKRKGRRSHGGGKSKKDHSPKQESMA